MINKNFVAVLNITLSESDPEGLNVLITSVGLRAVEICFEKCLDRFIHAGCIHRNVFAIIEIKHPERSDSFG